VAPFPLIRDRSLLPCKAIRLRMIGKRSNLRMRAFQEAGSFEIGSSESYVVT
jgi:hypothetical protein